MTSHEEDLTQSLYREPSIFEKVKGFVQLHFYQAMEDSEDLRVRARNAFRPVELTQEFVDALNAKIERDDNAFTQTAIKQYGRHVMAMNIPTEEGERRVGNRLFMRYDGVLGRLYQKLIPYVREDVTLPLPVEVKGKLAGLILGYVIEKEAQKKANYSF